MKKSTKGLGSMKTENATENGCLLTLTEIGITNALFAVEERKTIPATNRILITAPTAVQRWTEKGKAMNRLTHKTFSCMADFCTDTECEMYEECPALERYNRLKAYEDTGLEPKKVRLIKNCIAEVSQEYNTMFEYIVKFLTTDGVEVVRCKDCRFKNEPGQPNILCYNMKPDDFCSYGERKDDHE